MKGADFPDSISTVPPSTRNGKHREAKKNGAAPNPSAAPGADPHARPAAEPSAARPVCETFASVEAVPIDAPMWPLHPAAWFQPDLPPAAPVWTGLTIERHNRIPAPDFLQSEPAAANRPDAVDGSPGSLPPSGLWPGTRPEVPHSDLAPLGWDPRAVCRKEGGR